MKIYVEASDPLPSGEETAEYRGQKVMVLDYRSNPNGCNDELIAFVDDPANPFWVSGRELTIN